MKNNLSDLIDTKVYLCNNDFIIMNLNIKILTSQNILGAKNFEKLPTIIRVSITYEL